MLATSAGMADLLVRTGNTYSCGHSRCHTKNVAGGEARELHSSILRVSRTSLPKMLSSVRILMSGKQLWIGGEFPCVPVTLNQRKAGECGIRNCASGHDVCRSFSSPVPQHGGRREDLSRKEMLQRSEDTPSNNRRGLLLWSLLFSTARLSKVFDTAAAAAEDRTRELPLELYSDAKNGFTLLRPAPWNKVDKPGAAIFFEDPESRSSNIGVTVAPVRIANLDSFGTVNDIVNKLVKAERDKPSTKDVQIVEVFEKKLRHDTLLYSLEYTLDTTRGSKRVLTSVTVAGYKLYILSIVFADGPVASASSGLNDALHHVLNSFELLV